MPRVVVIDDDPELVDGSVRILELEGFEATGARTGEAGVRLVIQEKPDVALVDLRLPDIDGVEVLRRIHAAQVGTACVVVTGFADVGSTVEAVRLGACSVVEKPVFADQLIEVVKTTLATTGAARRNVVLELPEPHAMARLASASVRLIGWHADTPTLRLLGRAVGHAPGCLRNWCRTAGVRGRAFRDFSRALRAVWRLEAGHGERDANLLDIVDGRTLGRFRRQCGGTDDRLPASVDAFLGRQSLVPDPAFVAAVRTALASLKPATAGSGEAHPKPAQATPPSHPRTR